MKKMLFVMNPHAGTKKGKRVLTDIISIFNAAGYEMTCFMTAGPGHAIDIVKEHAAGKDLVVCCGGDGTFNETVSGLLQAGLDIPVGYIPAGSTNDFAASLRLPTNILEAARHIAEGTPVTYDLGVFGQRHFSYVASFGAFTKSSYATPQSVKNILGHTAYVLSGIAEIAQIRSHHVKVETPDGISVEGDFIFGAISNSTSMGGVLTLDPKVVDMRDGKFEVMLVRAPKHMSEIPECLRALQRKEYNCSMVTFFSAEQVKVYAPGDMPWTLDGEKEPGHEEVLVQNLHHAFRLMTKEVEA